VVAPHTLHNLSDSNRPVLVTGGTGFVGKHLVRHLQDQGDVVIATGLHAGGEEVEGTVWIDLRDAERVQQLVKEVRPQVIYHLGGIAFVPQADKDFELTLAVNVGGTHSVFKAAASLDEPIKVVLVSTGEVYGKIDASSLPVTEEVPVKPANNYSLTKVMAETVAHRYGRERHVEYVIMRPFNHIGAGQDDRFVTSSFARQLARIARGKAAPEIRVGNLEAARDFSDVRDIVAAYRRAGSLGDGIFNLGSGVPIAIRAVLDRLIAIAGLDVRVVVDQDRYRPSEVPVIYASVERARTVLGWSPRISLDASLEVVYRYWFDRE
jgi:GDP-4-dehydro-6-deoxy-D-mannose reductase